MQLFPGRFLYLLVAGIAMFDGVWLAVSSRFLFDLGPLIKPLCIFSVVILCLVVVAPKRYSTELVREVFGRGCNLIQGVIFTQLAWVALKLLNHATMSTNFPYADEMLSRWDSAVGFDWIAYFE